MVGLPLGRQAVLLTQHTTLNFKPVTSSWSEKTHTFQGWAQNTQCWPLWGNYPLTGSTLRIFKGSLYLIFN